MNAGQSGNDESTNGSLMDVARNASISHESQYGRIEAKGWYLVALVVLVAWVVVF